MPKLPRKHRAHNPAPTPYDTSARAVARELARRSAIPTRAPLETRCATFDASCELEHTTDRNASLRKWHLPMLEMPLSLAAACIGALPHRHAREAPGSTWISLMRSASAISGLIEWAPPEHRALLDAIESYEEHDSDAEWERLRAAAATFLRAHLAARGLAHVDTNAVARASSSAYADLLWENFLSAQRRYSTLGTKFTHVHTIRPSGNASVIGSVFSRIETTTSGERVTYIEGMLTCPFASYAHCHTARKLLTHVASWGTLLRASPHCQSRLWRQFLTSVDLGVPVHVS